MKFVKINSCKNLGIMLEFKQKLYICDVINKIIVNKYAN
jgi:hypothetical protein